MPFVYSEIVKTCINIFLSQRRIFCEEILDSISIFQEMIIAISFLTLYFGSNTPHFKLGESLMISMSESRPEICTACQYLLIQSNCRTKRTGVAL